MDGNTWIFIIVMAYIWIPTLLTSWYKKLRNPKIYFINLGFAITALIILICKYEPDLNFQDKGGLLMLVSPLLFLVFFKMFDYGAIKLFDRHLILANRITIDPREKFNLYDVIGFLVLVLMPFMIPMLIRELKIL